MMMCPDECGKQWRAKQGKLKWQNRNEKKQKKYGWKKKEKKEQEKKKQGKGKAMEIKKVAEEWEIWDDEEKVARSEKEVRKLIPEQFYK